MSSSGNLDPFGPKGQFGMWMGIQGDTINNFGCGPKGPMDCSVGTTPGEHWARRPTMRKEGQKLKVSVAKGAALGATPFWNGLGAKTNPFDENPDEKVTPNAFNSQGQFGAYMGIQVSFHPFKGPPSLPRAVRYAAARPSRPPPANVGWRGAG